MKGSRVQAVVQELRGEKIDIVPYSPDPATFVCNALQPAEVSRVLIDEGNHTMEIIVPDDQLSLAIGRRGQNVRLASQLAGWRLDIHSESRINEIRDRAWVSLSKVQGCSEFLIQTLYNHGIRCAEDMSTMDVEFLVQFPGIEQDNVGEVLRSARDVAEQERAEEARLKEEAEEAAQLADAAKELQAQITRTADDRMRMVRGVGDNAYDKLTAAGYKTVEAIAEADVAEVADATDLSETKAKQLRFGASQLLKQEAEVRETAERFEITVEDGVVKLPASVLEEVAAEEAAEAAAAEVEAVAVEATVVEGDAAETAADALPLEATQADDEGNLSSAETL
jgi:N utilization substance protein A